VCEEVLEVAKSLNISCQECGNFTMNHRCMFVKQDGLLLFEVCALCSVKLGSEEGIFCCAEHGPSMTALSVPVAPVALHPETAKKPP
jgi:hypothetical protein